MLAQVVMRMGRWIYNAMTRSYLFFADPKGLLAIGEWPEGAQGNLNTFWAPIMHMQVSENLISVVFPFWPDTKARVEAAGASAPPSARAWPQVLENAGIVLVQCALELADEQPQNPLHAKLLHVPEFMCALVPAAADRGWLHMNDH